MKQVIFSLILISSLIAAPKINIKETTKDWGVMQAKEMTLEHSYPVTNGGDSDLIISEVKPGCSCTIVDYPKLLKPGETGYIKAGLTVHAKSGTQSKSITVTSNDPNTPTVILYLKAKLLGPVNIEPQFKQYIANSPITDTFTVITDKQDFKLTSLRYMENKQSPEAAAYTIDNIPYSRISSSVRDAKGFYTIKYEYTMTIKTTTRQSGGLFYTSNHPKNANGQIKCFVDLPPNTPAKK